MMAHSGGNILGQGHAWAHLGSNTSCASNCRWNNMYLSAGGTTSMTDHSPGDSTVTAETLPWS